MDRSGCSSGTSSTGCKAPEISRNRRNKRGKSWTRLVLVVLMSAWQFFSPLGLWRNCLYYKMYFMYWSKQSSITWFEQSCSSRFCQKNENINSVYYRYIVAHANKFVAKFSSSSFEENEDWIPLTGSNHHIRWYLLLNFRFTEKIKNSME